MITTALTMLAGDRTKLIGIVFGLAFASVLITQQAGIFRGIMRQVAGHVRDMPQVDIWIADPASPFIEVQGPIHDRALAAMRGIDGVAWAVPLDRQVVTARVRGGDLVPCAALGLDDATLIGAPTPDRMVTGSLDDLRRPWSVIVDAHGAETKLAVREHGVERAMRVGDRLSVAGHELTVVGTCRTTTSLLLQPTIYLRRSACAALAPTPGRGCDLLLGGLAPGADARAVCAAIDARTGLVARTAAEMAAHTERFWLLHTGIPANFAVAIALGFIVGAAIAGQTFHQFVHDNRRAFAALKAMGMRDGRLALMILCQAVVAALIGDGLGVGAAAAFGWASRGTDLAFALEPGLLAFSLASVVLISAGAALVSVRQVARVDPALVFRT